MENSLDKLMKTTSEILPPILTEKSYCFLHLVSFPENSKALLNPALTTWEVRSGSGSVTLESPVESRRMHLGGEQVRVPRVGVHADISGGYREIDFKHRNKSCAL